MSEQDFDRSEKATPYKLQKAKEKGQVAKSPDVVSVVVFFVVVVFFYWRGLDGIRDLFKLDLNLLLQLGQGDVGSINYWRMLRTLLLDGLYLLLPFFIALMLTAIISNVAQTGVILSSEPVKPDFNRLNPMNGIKKFFSIRSLFDLFRTCFKLILLSLVAYLALKQIGPQLFHTAMLPPLEMIKNMQVDLVSLGFKMTLVLALLAFLDLMFVHREFAKKMRMSKRDVKDEAKNRDGDPRIRSRLRELRREMLKRSLAAAKTKNADVLITNPTHLAIALRYEHGKMESPQLLAKGAGSLAQAMRKMAVRHHIPVVQNKALARQLFREVDFDQHVPTHLYADVAKIMIWVFAMRKNKEALVKETLVAGEAV
ncbi:flagellar biosynthesis protein FlhB [Undibacterium sp. KW1]|uniref:EscU/YscU/HrcU family type III secretion system export apparatus switch protein n=1 Tax=Undibacterium sp. KW1 TaxID=2058624 RepID=UPI001331D8D7|nr:EscU/YscU/HrcU family type III secretion system export apparatus switch protein [Undibacterium sp. KW1]BBB62258.1 flagellar biosynthesis protein FlhB [Undibacterium sp. KW1]